MTPREALLLYALILAVGAFCVGLLVGRHVAPAGYVCGSNGMGAWCHQK